MSWFRRTPLVEARWAVIDCETSGLDVARDRLLSVGAVMVAGGRIELAHALDERVAQETPSAPDNILIHGIGADAQRSGQPLARAIEGLERFMGEGLPVAFHAPFDAAILRRHGLATRAKWLDLAALAPALFPHRKQQQLDDWLGAFGIAAHERHDALGDAFATAQLLLVALAEARRQGLDTVEDLRRLQRNRRWL